jgi:3-dehydroquinate synthase
MQTNESKINIIEDFEKEIKNLFEKYSKSKIFIISDENIVKNCFHFSHEIVNLKENTFILNAGESNKNLDNLSSIWEFLIKRKADKKSVILNFGGGVVCDIGGFAASTFKRGIKFINIPTTLLSQTDAAIGGKTGINFNSYKNEIGIINFPEQVLIFPEFIQTLDNEELFSGYAEMIKHGFISGKEFLDEVFAFIETENLQANIGKFRNLIERSVNIKLHFIKNDIFDSGERKLLNFGHTFGHAIESLFNATNRKITHGKAVAHGMIFELFLSNQKLNYSLKDFLDYSQKIIRIYGFLSFKKEDIKNIIDLMFHDKKNSDDKILTILLKETGIATFDNEISKKDIEESFNFYMQLSK